MALPIMLALAGPCAWLGCSMLAPPPEAHAEPSASESASSSSHDDAAPSDSGAAHGPSASAAQPSGGHGNRFPVPFAWEASSADPLARTRGLMRELLDTNASYAKGHPASFFKPFLDAEHPRATVITCSDSRVQSTAFDATPEDDLFFIRNIGNQIANSQGSVEYGVHHLKTPVLIIAGHTGCGAVKAAMGDTSKESESIQKELRPLVLPKPSGRPEDPKVWMEAVTANVHAQVARALALFPHELGSGDLTVVGVVYDHRNDAKLGHGRMQVVNVNGQTDPERIGGFIKALSPAGALPSPLPPRLTHR